MTLCDIVPPARRCTFGFVQRDSFSEEEAFQLFTKPRLHRLLAWAPNARKRSGMPCHHIPRLVYVCDCRPLSYRDSSVIPDQDIRPLDVSFCCAMLMGDQIGLRPLHIFFPFFNVFYSCIHLSLTHSAGSVLRQHRAMDIGRFDSKEKRAKVRCSSMV